MERIGDHVARDLVRLVGPIVSRPPGLDESADVGPKLSVIHLPLRYQQVLNRQVSNRPRMVSGRIHDGPEKRRCQPLDDPDLPLPSAAKQATGPSWPGLAATTLTPSERGAVLVTRKRRSAGRVPGHLQRAGHAALDGAGAVPAGDTGGVSASEKIADQIADILPGTARDERGR